MTPSLVLSTFDDNYRDSRVHSITLQLTILILLMKSGQAQSLKLDPV